MSRKFNALLVSGKYKISRLSGISQTITNYLLKDEACIEDNEFNRMVLLFLSRYVYRFIIHPTFKLDFKRKLLNPTTPQLNRIAKWLRRKVIRRHFPYGWLKKLDEVHRKEFEENYEKLRTRLKTDQIFSYEYLTNLRNLAQFVFNLVVGKFKFSELKGLYREVANYLGGLKTFLYDEELSYDFKWSFIIVICRIVYDTIVDQGYFKKPKVEREGIRIDLTENESIGIKLCVSEMEVKYKYFEEVDLVNKREFDEYYEKLQFRLNLDQIYGLTFIEVVRYLTMVVFDLIEGKCGRIPSTNFIRFIGEDLLRNWNANLKHKWIPKVILSREPISQLMLNEKIEEYNKELIELYLMKENENDEFNGHKELIINPSNDKDFLIKDLSSFNESRGIKGKNDEDKKQNKEIDEIEDLESIKEKIKRIDWEKLAPYPNYWAEKNLNPYIECSKDNPLYKDKIWLRWVYTNETLNLSDRKIAKICGLKNHKSVTHWRQKFNIPTKDEIGRYFNPSGYIELYMPKEYKHPELNPNGTKRIKRAEHIVKMEEHLMNSLSLKELSSHPCLINDGNGKFYIKKGCIVHHVNYRKHDNFIENLWLYESSFDHNHNNINIYLSGLIKLDQILFSEDNRKYYLNENYDFRALTRNQIAEIIKPVDFIRFDNIDLVKQEIKKMDWSGIDWTINIQLNKSTSRELVLDPYRDCSLKNPLYKHKEWVERIVNDSRFNLTDPRLGKLCNVSYQAAYKWRHLIHKIPVKSWGFERYLHTVPNRKQIYIKVPKSYGNPFAGKKVGFDYMLEHRYIMEKELARHPKKYHDYLVNDKYLKPECRVQHINLDSLDNRLENLFICRTQSEHEEIHSTLFDLINGLLKERFIIFRDGKYFLNY